MATSRKLREMGASDLPAALGTHDEGMCMGMTCAVRVQMAVDEAHSSFAASKVRNPAERAGPGCPEADVRSVDFAEERRLDRLIVTEFAACGFAERGRNVVLQKPTATGKTSLARALSKAACQRRMRAHYVRCPDLEDLWREARERPGGERKLARRYAAFQVLVLDEWPLDAPTSCSGASCWSSWRPATARAGRSSARSSARRTGTRGSGAASTPTSSWTASSKAPRGSGWASSTCAGSWGLEAAARRLIWRRWARGGGIVSRC